MKKPKFCDMDLAEMLQVRVFLDAKDESEVRFWIVRVFRVGPLCTPRQNGEKEGLAVDLRHFSTEHRREFFLRRIERFAQNRCFGNSGWGIGEGV